MMSGQYIEPLWIKFEQVMDTQYHKCLSAFITSFAHESHVPKNTFYCRDVDPYFSFSLPLAKSLWHGREREVRVLMKN